MKKSIFIMLASAAMVGCGGNSKEFSGRAPQAFVVEMVPSEVAQNGFASEEVVTGQPYEVACKKNDFEKAHKILEDMRPKGYSSDYDKEEYKKAYGYVYLAEVEYLINTFSIDDARPKVMYLLQEAFTSTNNGSDYIQLCRKICAILKEREEFDLAIDILRTMTNKFKYEYDIKKYYECFQYVYCANADYIIKNYNGKESVAKTALMLQNIPLEGEKIVSDGIHRYRDVLDGLGGYGNVYMYWYVNYNQLCDYILSTAINNGNKELAGAILKFYQEDIEVIEPESDDYGNYKRINGVVVDGDHAYVKLNKNSFNEATKKYQQAVELGLFE